MQARLLDLFVRLSQEAEGKPSEVGSHPSPHCEVEDRRLSDASFAKLLKDIDSFNLELAQQASANSIPNHVDRGGRNDVLLPSLTQPMLPR